MLKKKRVIIIATSSKTRGGITSVINSYKSTQLWRNWKCKWIATHIDKSLLHKTIYFFVSVLNFLCYVPFSQIVHVHLSGPTSLKRKKLFIYLSKFFNNKVIIHFHGFGTKPMIEDCYKELYQKIFNKANKIIVLSHNWKNNILKDFNLERKTIDVLHNPCVKITSKNERKKENIILFAGTLNERKNYKSLIKAFAQIYHKNPSWKLVLAGNGEISQAKKLSKELNVESHVKCVGWKSDDEKHYLFSRSSIFCLPSFAEGFPMAILDAWAYQLPVISSPVGGISDVAKHNENILLVDPHDTNNIAEMLDDLINNERLRKKLVLAAKEFSSSIFSLDSLEVKLHEIYSTLYYDSKTSGVFQNKHLQNQQ